MNTLKVTPFILLLLAGVSISCNDNDLENRLDLLTFEVNSVKLVNNILEFKYFLLDKKYSEILISQISEDNSTNKLRIDFEDGNSLEVDHGIVKNYILDAKNWEADFNFTDSTSIQTFYLGNIPEISSSDIVLNPFKNAPLTAMIKYTTPVKGKFQVTVVGQDGIESDIVRSFDYYDYEHSLEIIGLYPGYSNEVTLKFMSKDGIKRFVKSIQIVTQQLPLGLPDFGIVKQYEQVETNVLFLVNYRPTNIPFMVDAFGKIRWYSIGFSLTTKYGLQVFKNGNIGFGVSGNGQGSVYEYSMLGELIKEYSVYPVFQNVHHDVFEMPNGNFLITADKIGIPTVEDHIVEMDRTTGMITNVWDLREILPTDRYTLRKIGDGSDWFHINAVIYDDKDNSIVVSGQAQGVVKLTWNNELKWILAPHDGWSSEYVPYLLSPIIQAEFDWTWGQHAPCLLPNGNLLIFDNGFGRGFGTATSQYSRAVEYEITENQNNEGGTISQIWQYGKERGLEMFAPFISDVDYIEQSGTRLITAGSLEYNLTYTDNLNNSITPSPHRIETRIIEVNEAGIVLFEMTLSSLQHVGTTYRSEKIWLKK